MNSAATTILSQEARALSARLDGVRPFGLLEAMVPAASLSPSALLGIERSLADGTEEIRERVDRFLEWLEDGGGDDVDRARGRRRSGTRSGRQVTSKLEGTAKGGRRRRFQVGQGAEELCDGFRHRDFASPHGL